MLNNVKKNDGGCQVMQKNHQMKLEKHQIALGKC